METTEIETTAASAEPVRSMFPPKVVSVTDGHGDTWDRQGASYWRLDASTPTGYAAVLSEAELSVVYGPLTACRWLTSNGIRETDPAADAR